MADINGVAVCNIAKYSDRNMALEFEYKRTVDRRHYGIFHGDDNKFWVVSGGRNIKRLAEAGYERIYNN